MKTWSVVFRAGMTIGACVLLWTCGTMIYKDKHKNDDWCCVKPRVYCKIVTKCTQESKYFCQQYEQVEQCDKLCDGWLPEKNGMSGPCIGNERFDGSGLIDRDAGVVRTWRETGR